MSPLSRQIISIDMLLQEIEELKTPYESVAYNPTQEHDFDYLETKHTKLLQQCVSAYQVLLKSLEDTSEYEFRQILEQADLNQSLGSKQLLSIHTKLLNWVLDFHSARLKAENIADSDFSQQAEIKLDLYQTKAFKAKNQIKALAQALGDKEYNLFLQRFKLQQTSLASLL